MKEELALSDLSLDFGMYLKFDYLVRISKQYFILMIIIA